MRSYQSRLHDRSRAQRAADGMIRACEVAVELLTICALVGVVVILMALA